MGVDDDRGRPNVAAAGGANPCSISTTSLPPLSLSLSLSLAISTSSRRISAAAPSSCPLPPPLPLPPPPTQRQRGQTGPYTQHKRDGVPPRNETTAVAMGLLGHSGPSGSGDRPGRKSRRTLRRPREEHALDDRCQQGTPPTDDFGGPSGKGVPSATAEARPFL